MLSRVIVISRKRPNRGHNKTFFCVPRRMVYEEPKRQSNFLSFTLRAYAPRNLLQHKQHLSLLSMETKQVLVEIMVPSVRLAE